MTTPTNEFRDLPTGFTLSKGSHSSFDAGACLMEAVAYVAGEPHSDHPRCASPVLTEIAIRLNDRWDDEERQLLAPLIRKLVGTRATLDVDRKRSYAMIDASIREITPLGLEAVKWTDLATRLRDLAPIVDTATARAAHAVCSSVRDEARKRRSASAAYYAYAYAYAYAAAAAAAAADAAAAAAAYAGAYYADAADAAYADAAAAAAASAASAAYAKGLEERARIRSLARRPIIEATVRAVERAISITEAP